MRENVYGLYVSEKYGKIKVYENRNGAKYWVEVNDDYDLEFSTQQDLDKWLEDRGDSPARFLGYDEDEE